jgi:hypothetical protein
VNTTAVLSLRHFRELELLLVSRCTTGEIVKPLFPLLSGIFGASRMKEEDEKTLECYYDDKCKLTESTDERRQTTRS